MKSKLGQKTEKNTMRDKLVALCSELSPTKIQGLVDMAEQNGAHLD
jgi:hypothetical protein